MKKISCYDLRIDCLFESCAHTTDDAIKKIKEHFKKEHYDYWFEDLRHMSDVEFKKMIMQYVKNSD